ncbi:MAG: hypothetical protein AB9866_00680 [Syntrophobacteraceae bacterium]
MSSQDIILHLIFTGIELTGPDSGFQVYVGMSVVVSKKVKRAENEDVRRLKRKPFDSVLDWKSVIGTTGFEPAVVLYQQLSGQAVEHMWNTS